LDGANGIVAAFFLVQEGVDGLFPAGGFAALRQSLITYEYLYVDIL